MNGQFNNNTESQVPNNNLNTNGLNMNNNIPNQLNTVPNNPNQGVLLQHNLNFAPQNLQNNIPNPQNINTNPVLSNSNQVNLGNSKEDMINIQQNNKFIMNDIQNETSLNNLNVDGEYNNMSRPDYSQEPQVMENLNKKKKNTVAITNELKTVIIIALILLIFIFIMPYIFDAIRKIIY